MLLKILKNQAKMSGRLLGEFEFSHTCQDISFFSNKVTVLRKSGKEDEIPIIIPEVLLYDGYAKDIYVDMEGEIRSFTTKKKHLDIFLFVKNIQYNKYEPCKNEIYLKGNLSRESVLGTTPRGRSRTDFMVKVKGNFEKSYDIPCVCWGQFAVSAFDVNLGEEMSLVGRMQSRKYIKHGQIKETYEVSASYMEKN